MWPDKGHREALKGEEMQSGRYVFVCCLLLERASSHSGERNTRSALEWPFFSRRRGQDQTTEGRSAEQVASLQQHTLSTLPTPAVGLWAGWLCGQSLVEPSVSFTDSERRVGAQFSGRSTGRGQVYSPCRPLLHPTCRLLQMPRLQ